MEDDRLFVDPEELALDAMRLHRKANVQTGDASWVLTPLAREHHRTACAALVQARASFTLAHYYAMRKE